MNTAVNIEPRIKNIEINNETITAHLEDARTISVPFEHSKKKLKTDTNKITHSKTGLQLQTQQS